MRDMVWNYDYLLKKAEQLDECLPNLIENQDWNAIEENLEIPTSEWAGATADAYRSCVRRAINDHKADVVLKAPGVIKSVVDDMRARESRVAEANRNAFRRF